jgi:hypothetical protein
MSVQRGRMALSSITGPVEGLAVPAARRGLAPPSIPAVSPVYWPSQPAGSMATPSTSALTPPTSGLNGGSCSG